MHFKYETTFIYAPTKEPRTLLYMVNNDLTGDATRDFHKTSFSVRICNAKNDNNFALTKNLEAYLPMSSD